jgi:hypothetical protein
MNWSGVTRVCAAVCADGTRRAVIRRAPTGIAASTSPAADTSPPIYPTARECSGSRKPTCSNRSSTSSPAASSAPTACACCKPNSRRHTPTNGTSTTPSARASTERLDQRPRLAVQRQARQHLVRQVARPAGPAREASRSRLTGKGSPPQGFLREREAEERLDEILVDARRGQLRQERTGYTFADIAWDWFDRGPFERDWSASTQVDYRSVLVAHLLPEFGPKRIETITAKQIEQWRNRLAEDGTRKRKTVNKIVAQAHAVFQHAVEHFGLVLNVVTDQAAARDQRSSTLRLLLARGDREARSHRGQGLPSRPQPPSRKRDRARPARRRGPTGRRDIPDGSSRGTTPQRTVGAALGGHRLPAVLDPRLRRLQRQTDRQAEAPQVAHRADGRQGRSCAEGAEEARTPTSPEATTSS